MNNGVGNMMTEQEAAEILDTKRGLERELHSLAKRICADREAGNNVTADHLTRVYSVIARGAADWMERRCGRA